MHGLFSILYNNICLNTRKLFSNSKSNFSSSHGHKRRYSQVIFFFDDQWADLIEIASEPLCTKKRLCFISFDGIFFFWVNSAYAKTTKFIIVRLKLSHHLGTKKMCNGERLQITIQIKPWFATFFYFRCSKSFNILIITSNTILIRLRVLKI